MDINDINYLTVQVRDKIYDFKIIRKINAFAVNEDYNRYYCLAIYNNAVISIYVRVKDTEIVFIRPLRLINIYGALIESDEMNIIKYY